MISIPDDARIFLHGGFVDLRNGFDGLSFAAHNSFKDEMSSKSYFVFINRRRTRMKILYWGCDHLAIWYTRLQKGVFFPPDGLVNASINRHQLQRILSGKTLEYLGCPHSKL